MNVVPVVELDNLTVRLGRREILRGISCRLGTSGRGKAVGLLGPNGAGKSTLIMTMLAVPFAVTTGRRGALYGVGVGIVVAIVYWITMSIFAAIGAGGWIAPMLAAWAPNILFGAVALYLVLTVRT